MKKKLNPWAQIAMHGLFLTFYSAQGQGLIDDSVAGKWMNTVVGSTQSVLAIYGVFTPSPNRKKLTDPASSGGE